MGYGLGGASASALTPNGSKPAISVLGDGGFWHNGLLSSIGNAVFNKNGNIHIIVDNGYSAAAAAGTSLPPRIGAALRREADSGDLEGDWRPLGLDHAGYLTM